MTNRISPAQLDIYFNRRKNILTDIFVPLGQNYVVLSAASNEVPTESLSLDPEIAGSIAALLPSTTHTFSLNSIAGPDALNPKNLVKVRSASTLNPILSSSREVYGLLQAPSIMITGDNFDDLSHQAQLSFVRENAAGTALEPCPLADIGNTLINYQYTARFSFKDILETDFEPIFFQEPVQGGSSPTAETSIARIFMLMGS